MTVQPNPAVRQCLEYITACYPTFKLTDAVVMVWEDQLGHYPPGVLLPAVRAVCGRHTFGAPAPAHVREQIEGRIETIRVPVMEWPSGPAIRDDAGNLISQPYQKLGSDGRPVYRYEERRVFPDGRSEPLALPVVRLPSAEWRDGPGQIGDGIDAALRELSGNTSHAEDV